VTTTLTTDLLAHVAAVRDGACDDTDLLVLADKLDEAANSQPAEYDQCKKCYGAGEVRGWLVDSPCPVCGGNGSAPRPNALRGRAELIRVQCEIARIPDLRRANAGEGGIEWIRSLDRDHPAYVEDRRLLDRFRALRDRERDLLARNPAWLDVSCPECDGSGRNEYTLSGNCSLCKGAKDLLKRFVDDRTWATEPSATITRGFLDVTLHRTLCWRAEDLWDKGEPETVPHPVLRAVLASPAGPWVRRVRVEGVEPTLDEGGWEWYGLPDPLCTPETKDTFDTAEAATDTLAHAVPIWARSAK